MANIFETIPSVPRHPGSWRIRLTISEVLPRVRLSRNYEIWQYVLADFQGNEVIASLWGRNVTRLGALMQQFTVVEIENAQITPSSQCFSIIPRSTEWVLDYDTIVRRIDNVTPNYQPLLTNIIRMSEINTAVEQGANAINIMAIVIKCSPEIMREGIRKSNKMQHLTLIDTSSVPRLLIICGKMVDDLSQSLTDACLTSSAIVSRHLKVPSFQGGSLLATGYSSFTMNPVAVEVNELETWFAEVSQEMLPVWLLGQP